MARKEGEKNIRKRGLEKVGTGHHGTLEAAGGGMWITQSCIVHAFSLSTRLYQIPPMGQAPGAGCAVINEGKTLFLLPGSHRWWEEVEGTSVTQVIAEITIALVHRALEGRSLRLAETIQGGETTGDVLE